MRIPASTPVQFSGVKPSPRFGKENEKKAEKPEDMIVELTKGKYYVNKNPHVSMDDTVMLKPCTSYEDALRQARELFADYKRKGIL